MNFEDWWNKYGGLISFAAAVAIVVMIGFITWKVTKVK